MNRAKLQARHCRYYRSYLCCTYSPEKPWAWCRETSGMDEQNHMPRIVRC